VRRNLIVQFLLIVLTAASLWAACLGEVKCPVHDVATVYFAGKQKFYEGHFWYLYHCSGGSRKGHDFWVRCDP
jgi:hypothetical protein